MSDTLYHLLALEKKGIRMATAGPDVTKNLDRELGGDPRRKERD